MKCNKDNGNANDTNQSTEELDKLDVQEPRFLGLGNNTFSFSYRMYCLLRNIIALSVIITFGVYQAFLSRTLPLHIYGDIIHEFDPWFNFRATKYLSENGWHAFFHWFDRMSWYPIGRPVGTTIYPGLQITAVAIHRALGALGYPMTLTHVCLMMPPAFASLSTVIIAFFSWELSGSLTCTAWSSVTFAIIPAYSARSMAGEFDNECIAVAAMICTFYFWVRSLRTPSSWPIGVVTGLAYGYMVASWGGYIFVLNMVALHAGVTALVDWMHNRYNASLVKAYGLFFIIGTAIAVRVPPVGLTPFKSLEQLSAVVVFAFLVALHLSEAQRVKAGVEVRSRACLRMRLRVLSMMAVGFCAIAIMSVPTGYFGPLSSRVRALFVKHTRTGNPLVDSVAEHQPTNVAAFFIFLHFLFPVTLVGSIVIPFCRVHNVHALSFTLLYVVLAMFFCAKMSRLSVLTAAPVCVVSGYVLGRLTDMCIGQLFWNDKRHTPVFIEKVLRRTIEGSVVPPQPFSSKHSLGHRFVRMGAALITLVVLLFMWENFSTSSLDLMAVYANPRVVFPSQDEGGKAFVVKDYLDAYQWLKMKTPEDARILAWWDYGYQITGIGERTSLADGNTWNHEHIATLGKMLTSPIEEAHSLVRHMADYVLIWSGQTGDDLRKSPHMARIGNSVYRDICPKDPLCAHFGFFDHGFKRPTPMMRKSLLYHLHSAGLVEDVHVPPHLFQEVYRSRYSLVRIYKVMNVSEESKAWIADPANHVCSEKEPWICPGQYPPAKEIQDMLAKRVDFSQLEGFNDGWSE